MEPGSAGTIYVELQGKWNEAQLRGEVARGQAQANSGGGHVGGAGTRVSPGANAAVTPEGIRYARASGFARGGPEGEIGAIHGLIDDGGLSARRMTGLQADVLRIRGYEAQRFAAGVSPTNIRDYSGMSRRPDPLGGQVEDMFNSMMRADSQRHANAAAMGAGWMARGTRGAARPTQGPFGGPSYADISYRPRPDGLEGQVSDLFDSAFDASRREVQANDRERDRIVGQFRRGRKEYAEQRSLSSERDSAVQAFRNARDQTTLRGVGLESFGATIGRQQGTFNQGLSELAKQEQDLSRVVKDETQIRKQGVERMRRSAEFRAGANPHVMSTGMMMNFMFGGWEVASAATAMPRAMRMGVGKDPMQQLALQDKAIQQMTGGPLGSQVGMFAELADMAGANNPSQYAKRTDAGGSIMRAIATMGQAWGGYTNAREGAINADATEKFRRQMDVGERKANEALTMRSASGFGAINALYRSSMNAINDEFQGSFPIPSDEKEKRRRRVEGIAMRDADQSGMDIVAQKIAGAIGSAFAGIDSTINGGGLTRGMVPTMRDFGRANILSRQREATQRADWMGDRAMLHRRGSSSARAGGRGLTADAMDIFADADMEFEEHRKTNTKRANLALEIGRNNLLAFQNGLRDMQVGTSTGFNPMLTDLSGQATQKSDMKDIAEAIRKSNELLQQIANKEGGMAP